MNVMAWLSLRGKTSPVPGEDVTIGDKKGNLARERLRGFVLIFVFLHKMFCGQGFPLDKRANVSYYI